MSDAGPVDAGLDAGPDDDGLDAGVVDGGLLDCERMVTVTHTGADDADYALRVALTPFDGLLDDGVNIRFRTLDDNPLPHALTTIAGGTGDVWVRVPVVRDGEQIIASACDPAGTDVRDPDAVFDVFGWTTEGDGWSTACSAGAVPPVSTTLTAMLAMPM